MKRLLALFLLIPSAAFADTLTVNSGPYGDQIVTINGGSYYGGSYTGVLEPSGQTYDIYCVDTKDDINFGATYGVTVGMLSGATFQGVANNAVAASNIASVMGAAFDLATPAELTSQDWNTGLQLALWTAEYVGLPSLVPNGFFSGGSALAVADANTILANAATGGLFTLDGFAHTYLFTGVVGGYDAYNHRGQDMVTWVPENGAPPALTPVPEPSSFALLGLGGMGLAIGAYRRRRIVTA
jgi:hypothetical protein